MDNSTNDCTSFDRIVATDFPATIKQEPVLWPDDAHQSDCVPVELDDDWLFCSRVYNKLKQIPDGRNKETFKCHVDAELLDMVFGKSAAILPSSAPDSGVNLELKPDISGHTWLTRLIFFPCKKILDCWWMFSSWFFCHHSYGVEWCMPAGSFFVRLFIYLSAM